MAQQPVRYMSVESEDDASEASDHRPVHQKIVHQPPSSAEPTQRPKSVKRTRSPMLSSDDAHAMDNSNKDIKSGAHKKSKTAASPTDGTQQTLELLTPKEQKKIRKAKRVHERIIAGGKRVKDAALHVTDKLSRRNSFEMQDVASSPAKASPDDNLLSIDKSRALAVSSSTIFSKFAEYLPHFDTKGTKEIKPYYRTRNSWKKVSSEPTMSIHKYFDSMYNDFHPKAYVIAPDVDVLYVGHPIDRPKDIRARPFSLFWKNMKKPHKMDDSRVVYRAEFVCARNCSELKTGKSEPAVVHKSNDQTDEVLLNVSESDDGGSEAAYESDDSSANSVQEEGVIEGGGGGGRGRPRKIKRKCKVQLVVEVCAGDLTMANIYIKGDHGRVLAAKDLAPSHYIRQGIIEQASHFRLTAAKIMRFLTPAYMNGAVPEHRQHSATNVKDIVKNVRRAERIDSDPLRCLETFQEANKKSVFFFRGPKTDNTSPSKRVSSKNSPTKFAAGLKNTFALQSLILFGRTNGCGLDSSHRNKNELRAPVSFLNTFNDQQHVLPGTVYISSDVRTATIAEFLEKTKEEVIKHAQEIVDGTVEIAKGHEADAERVRAEALLIVENKKWEPAFIMIDKSRANLNGIRQVWPDVLVRLCQFHIIQAIIRWDRDDRHPGLRGPRPRLNLARKHLLLRAFRELQRCNSPQEWADCVRLFDERVGLILEGSPVAKDTVMGYFRENWFTDEWLECWTDMSLPADKYHEGTLSTNNWTERAFKTFDEVFLDSRANKSVFRLVLVIVNEWFPYYEVWQNKRERPDAAETAKYQDAWKIWGTEGAIVKLRPDKNGNSRYRVADVVRGKVRARYPVEH